VRDLDPFCRALDAVAHRRVVIEAPRTIPPVASMTCGNTSTGSTVP
jgi:hypothetical protein